MQLLVNSTCVLLSMCRYMDYKKNDNDIHACINGYVILYTQSVQCVQLLNPSVKEYIIQLLSC